MRLIVEDHFTTRRRRKLRWQQLALSLALAILVIQLIGMVFHHHSLAEQSSACISCDLAADFPAPLPTMPVPTLTPVLVFAYRAAIQLAYAFVPVPYNYLTPHSQAPPFIATV
jgi:hypothetical protein